MLKNSFFLLFIILFSVANAQQEEDDYAKLKGYNSNMRVNYFNKMIGQVELNSDFENYFIPRLNFSQDLETAIVPNNVLRLKFSFDYKFLGLYFSITPGFFQTNKLDPSKGKTQTTDFSFKFFYSDNLRQEVTFKKIKGFYLQDLISLEAIEILPNLEISTYGGRTFYIINKNFSYRSFESMTERQIKSNGSVVPSISYYLSELNTNQEDIQNASLSQIKSFDLNLQVGYMHNFIFRKNWFSTLGVHPGFGFNKSNSYNFEPNSTIKVKTETFNLNYNIDLNAALGYNNKNLFLGFKSNYRNFNLNNNANSIKNDRLSFGIYTGYRFNEIKRVKKAFKYIERKLKI